MREIPNLHDDISHIHISVITLIDHAIQRDIILRAIQCSSQKKLIKRQFCGRGIMLWKYVILARMKKKREKEKSRREKR